MSEWLKKKCKPCEGNQEPMDDKTIQNMLKTIDGWAYDGGLIVKTFSFKNFYQTMEFANAVAWIVNNEDHHPDLQLSYKKCVITFKTHSIDGISENDFIWDAKIDVLAKIEQ